MLKGAQFITIHIFSGSFVTIFNPEQTRKVSSVATCHTVLTSCSPGDDQARVGLNRLEDERLLPWPLRSLSKKQNWEMCRWDGRSENSNFWGSELNIDVRSEAVETCLSTYPMLVAVTAVDAEGCRSAADVLRSTVVFPVPLPPWHTNRRSWR